MLRLALPVLAGALLVALLGWLGARMSAPAILAPLEAQASQAIAAAGGAGIEARFTIGNGTPTRHPTLIGGEEFDDTTRAAVAKAVYAVPGIGSVRWSDGVRNATTIEMQENPLHCQEDVEALLRARTIRFEEGSAAIDAASRDLVHEVANALRPCLGAIIAITGHTDRSGTEPGNLALSQERADAVRQALMRRGIPADGLRARGVGSSQPVEGLAPQDPANRRIDFDVVETVPLAPTPIDTPGPR